MDIVDYPQLENLIIQRDSVILIYENDIINCVMIYHVDNDIMCVEIFHTAETKNYESIISVLFKDKLNIGHKFVKFVKINDKNIRFILDMIIESEPLFFCKKEKPIYLGNRLYIGHNPYSFFDDIIKIVLFDHKDLKIGLI
jgi:hypothetical protein